MKHGQALAGVGLAGLFSGLAVDLVSLPGALAGAESFWTARL
jgi:hypothetical protein